MTEATVPADSSLVGKTVADLEKMGEGEVEVSTIIRERFRRYTPSPSWAIEPEDVLLLEGEPAALERIVVQARLRLSGGEDNAGGSEDRQREFRRHGGGGDARIRRSSDARHGVRISASATRSACSL